MAGKKGKPARKPEAQRPRSPKPKSTRRSSTSPTGSSSIQPEDLSLTRMLETLKPHDHLCLIYESQEEWRTAVVPFISIGLKRGEKCIYIVDTSTAKEIRKYLNEEGVDVASAEKSGQLSILHETEAYTRKGPFDPDKMIALLVSETEKAVAEGYPALRVTGEMTWVLHGRPGSERLLEYEAKLNRDLFPKYPCLAICQYDRWKFDPEIIKGVIMTHPLLVRDSTIHRNFYYVPPEEFLNRKLAEVEVQHWLNNIEREKQIQETLRQSEERYRTFTEQSVQGLAVMQDFHIVFANAAFAEISGYSVEELLSLPPAKVQAMIHPEDQALVWGRFKDRLAGKTVPPRYEYRGIRKNQTVCWLEMHSSRIEYGGKPAILGAIIDITERKQAGDAIRDSEEKYHQLFELSSDALFLIEVETGKILDLNKAAIEIYGYSREEALQMKNTDFSAEPDETRKATLELEEHIPVRYHRRKDGATFPTDISVAYYTWYGKQVCLAAIRDITERKLAEEALMESEERYRLLVEISPEAIAVHSEGKVVFVNSAALKLFGASSLDQVIGKPVTDFVPPDYHAVIAERMRKAMETGTAPPILEEKFIRIDGTVIDVEVRAAPLVYQGKMSMQVIASDITDRKRADEALRESEEKMKRQYKNIPVPTYTWQRVGEDLLLIDYNDAAAAITHGVVANYLGKKASEMYHHRPDMVEELLRCSTEKAIISREMSYHFKATGESKDFAVTYVFMPPDLLMVHTEDITERKRAAEELERAVEELQRSNAELERFAYVASHDLQEPLRMVSSYTQLLERRYKDKLDADANDFINYAVSGANRMQELLNDLLVYSRVGTQAKPFKGTDMEAVLKAALDNLKVAIKESKARVTHDPLPTVMADEGQMVQVLQNLVGNAVKFRGKKLPHIHVSAEQRNSEWVFSVKDNGIGIEPQHFGRIFLIFQRLPREEYPGTGAGLAIAQKIIERHGGRMWVGSQPGKGSTFYFSIQATGARPKAKGKRHNRRETEGDS